jgi:transcription antitermination factor NusG
VRIGSGLVPVPEAVMTPLLSLSSSPKTSDVLFSEGDEVAIASGVFAGLRGVFKLAKGKDRAEVFIALLGKERPITVALDDLAIH